jgi:hypothetical protein
VCCAVVFEEQHSGPVKEAAAEAVSRIEKAAQVVLKHCLPAARTVVEGAVQVVVLNYCLGAARIVAEEAAQLAAPEQCLAVERTAVEVAARHCWPAVAAEEVESKAEELAQVVVPEH